MFILLTDQLVGTCLLTDWATVSPTVAATFIWCTLASCWTSFGPQTDFEHSLGVVDPLPEKRELVLCLEGVLFHACVVMARLVKRCYDCSVALAIQVMRTMPAEVTPVNLLERLYVMFFMFFAFSAFAICVASITHAFFKFSERSRGFEEEMSAVRMYLRKIKADPPIQMAVKNFLQFVYDQHFTHSKEMTPLKNLPNSLKSLLKFARLKQHLLKLSVFASLPDKAVFYISDIAEEHFVATGTCLSKKDHIAEAAWVVMCGVLSVQDESSNCVNLRLDVVDELCLLSSSNCVSPNTVIVSACSELLRVNQDQFFKCLQQHDHFLCARQETVFGCGCLDEKRVVTHGRGTHSVQDVSAAVVAVVS